MRCEYGEDRTGLVFALLLEISGVPRKIVAEDYTVQPTPYGLYSTNSWPAVRGTAPPREADLGRFMPRREVILRTLANLDADCHGPVSRVLS